MAKIITKRQMEVLEIIKNFIFENAESPTLSELQAKLNINTKRGVVKHLEALERKGYIYRAGGPRSIEVIEDSRARTLSVPILGYANAGKPLVFAEEDIVGMIQVDQQFIKDTNNTFSLIVQGDSMNMRTVNKVPISDKNFVIVQKGVPIVDGDVVLAVVDNAATLKTFKKSENSIILYPESNNPTHTPIYLSDDIEGFINGKVIAVLENPVG